MSMATGANVRRGMTGYKDVIPKGYQKGQLTQFTPEQMQLFGTMFPHLMPEGFLSRLASGDQSAFEEMEAPALRQFGALQGNMASRFSGMGTGARRSSGFQNTMNQATSDFAQSLQSQRVGLRNQALRDLMGMSESLLNQRPTEKFLTEKPLSFIQQLMLSLGGPTVQAAGTYGTMKGLQGGGGGGQSAINNAMYSLFPYIV